MSSGAAWAAVLVMAATVLALRYAGFSLMRHVPITPAVERFLERMSVSVLVAIVASALAAGGPRTAFAVTTGIAMMLVTRSPVAAMLTGVAAGAAWSGFAQ